MKAEGPILIASSSFDEHTHGPVYRKLCQRGYAVELYLTDLVFEGRERFNLDISVDGRLHVSYEGRGIGPDDIAAGWYWKVANFRIQDAEDNVSKQLSLVNEMTQCNGSIWSLYPDDVWLSSPRAVQAAERKLGQLLVAHQVGFQIPHTHLGSRWEDIETAFATDGQDIAVKMFRGVIADQNEIKAMYTTHLTPGLLHELRHSTIAFPGIYQPFLSKSREWRITLVGTEAFAGAIYTDDSAKDDWRRMQTTAAVALRRDPLPDEVAELCRAYMRRTGLGIGSFDLVETTDGEVVFLECNPQGQFGFLEETLDLPIFDAIVDRLIEIATR
jgi:hypothetical protein